MEEEQTKSFFILNYVYFFNNTRTQKTKMRFGIDAEFDGDTTPCK
jgi:hypothetical protein